jgi:hypothetical protein
MSREGEDPTILAEAGDSSSAVTLGRWPVVVYDQVAIPPWVATATDRGASQPMDHGLPQPPILFLSKKEGETRETSSKPTTRFGLRPSAEPGDL